MSRQILDEGLRWARQVKEAEPLLKLEQALVEIAEAWDRISVVKEELGQLEAERLKQEEAFGSFVRDLERQRLEAREQHLKLLCDLEAELIEKRKWVDVEKQRLQGEVKRLRESAHQIKAQYENQIQALQAALVQAREEHRAEMERLEKEKAELSQQLTELRREWAKLRGCLTRVWGELEAIQNVRLDKGERTDGQPVMEAKGV